jgi:putative membrane protein
VDGLRIRRGLLETRSQTVPAGRVQAVGVEWPLLWRGHGWVRARMDVAGLPAQENSRMREGTLLPVGDVPTARQVIAEVLPGFDLTSVAVYPVPRRARWLAPLRAGVLGYTLTDTAFASRDGLLTRRLVVVPYGRIQSIRVVQRPLQRLLRLASVHFDTAGNGLPAIAEHRRLAEIGPLLIEVAERARAARHA